MRDTYEALLEHCGGTDLTSDTQRLACRRVATLEAELIFLEDEFAQKRAEGDEPSSKRLDLYGRLADRQRRLSDPLGWKRTARDVTPRLSDIISGSARNGAAP